MAFRSPKLEDNTCPICLYIFVQPVTMPCGHELCLGCFKQNVEEANFCCPLCRIRISTWARRAARNKTLVNEKRWKYIQEHFAEQVQNRLDGKEEDDEEMQALNVSIKLAEPGEIRTEYEQQLKQLQEQRREERRKELEASERLILQLQDEEKKKQEELEKIARQDEELAKQISENDVISPLGIEQRLRGSHSSCSDDTIMSKSESLEMFMRSENNMSKSPYPYRCKTPVGAGKLCIDKDKALMMEDKFHLQKIKRDRNLITTQDIANLEEQFKLQRDVTNTESIEIDNLCGGSESNMSLSMTHVVSNSNLNRNEILDQMSSGLDVGVNFLGANPASGDLIVLSPLPNLVEEYSVQKTSAKTSTSNSTCSFKSAEDEGQERSVSALSTDSITQELSHFRPIRSCPLTPPRKLPSGKVVEPQLIRTTPRNLHKSGFGSPLETNLSDIDAGSPIMQRRLSALAEERKDKVILMSKCTSTGKGEENRNPQPMENSANPVTRRNLSSSRSVEFKDISNSPINTKRKMEINELEDSSVKKKLIIPLVPDLEEIYIQDSSLKVTKNITTKIPKDRLSRSKKDKTAKVRYTSGESADGVNSPQLSIMKWMTQNDEMKHCVRNDKSSYFIDSKRDEVDGDKSETKTKKLKGRLGRSEADVGKKHEAEKVLLQNEVVLTRPRHRRRRISADKDDYIYYSGKRSRKQPVSDAEESDTGTTWSSSDNDSRTSDGSILSGPDRKKRKLNMFKSEKIEKKQPIKQLKFKPKPVLKSTKQVKRSSNRSLTNKDKSNNRRNKTMHDFFSNNKSQDNDLAEVEEDDDCHLSQEEKDRKMAESLQRQFELEAKLHLTSLRFKGSTDEYSFRSNRRQKNLSV